MSIAILKRKTFRGGNPRISPISASDNSNLGFSINGTLRIGPQVGVNLGSSFFNPNNNLQKLCINSNSDSKSCSNDNNKIKQSVKNTSGLLSSRIRRLNKDNCSNCNNNETFINKTTNLQISQGEYLNIKSRMNRCSDQNNDGSLKSINSICKQQSQVNDNCKERSNCRIKSNTPIIGFQNRPQRARNNNLITITKTPSVAMSSGEKIARIRICDSNQ